MAGDDLDDLIETGLIIRRRHQHQSTIIRRNLALPNRKGYPASAALAARFDLFAKVIAQHHEIAICLVCLKGRGGLQRSVLRLFGRTYSAAIALPIRLFQKI